MNISALTHPFIQDRAALQDFADALPDYASATEREVERLLKSPAEAGAVAGLFRAIHNIKGDAMLCRFDTATELARPIENLLARLRANEIAFSELLAEVILLTIDRLELATEACLLSKPLEHLKLVALAEGLTHLSSTISHQINAECARLIEAVTGFRPATDKAAISRQQPIATNNFKISADLAFFRNLALQLDLRSPMLKGRSIRVSRLAFETNQLAGQIIDPEQLEAAALMHDIGMMLLPDTLWLNNGHLSDADRALLREHPGYGAGLLERMPHWQEAARIVREHHEMPDGKGYPAGMASAEICPGAKLLGIVDAFESVILKQAHRGRSRSFLRAVAEINASPNQFAPEWIGPFNRVIRGLLERA